METNEKIKPTEEKQRRKVLLYLNTLNPCLNPQLFHQFPGLGNVIIGRHDDPSEKSNTGGN